MPGEQRLIYWDADVFLYYFEKRADRIGILDALLTEDFDAPLDDFKEYME